MAFSFCEAMAEICERHGNQLVTDTLSPLVIPVISSWETSGEIANVDDTNAAAETAAKGKKGAHIMFTFAAPLEMHLEKLEADVSRSIRKDQCIMVSNAIQTWS
ncbi:hypothetical protein FRC10_000156 [Ceratobasidium sp. 414]|nr:hypothetical protein FRC10_000156 [Ceratobasidium sp. 414]